MYLVLGHLGVGSKEGVLPVNRQEVLGVDHLQNLLLLLLVGVAARVQILAAAHGDFAPKARQAVHHLHHARLVARNHLRVGNTHTSEH